MSSTITLHCRFFASIRERLASSEETVTLPHDINTVAQVRAWLMERGGAWQVLGGHHVCMAYQQEICDGLTKIENGGELAFFPPVTGG
jgi:molybdopterin synthase sulfur carrier subunit